MPDFASIALSIAMVIGPVIGYVDQYMITRRKRSSAGFNSLTCGVLLVANILRVFFWFGKRFDTTLLVQSIVMIVAQLVLLEIIVRFRPNPSPTTLYSDVRNSLSSSSLSSRSSSSSSSDDEQTLIDQSGEAQPAYRRSRFHLPFNLWSWKHYLNYINFLLALTTVVAILYLSLGQFGWFVELLGALSVGIESTLPLPQCISNFRRRSTAGFSLLVLATWFLGDGFKLFYFVFTHAPIQFIVCGGVQLSIDTVIVLQFIIFSDTFKKRFNFSQQTGARGALLHDDEEGEALV